MKGIDLTERAIKHTSNRLNLLNLHSELQVGDAENLPYGEASFDLVYSWGVLHHTPNTSLSISEVYRVLRKGGEAKIMLYNKHSIVGYMLWVRYALLRFSPFTSLDEIYSKYLESPGTKAFSIKEIHEMFRQFASVSVQIVLSHSDLLPSEAGQRHRGKILSFAKLIWPRWFIRTFLKSQGLMLLISAKK